MARSRPCPLIPFHGPPGGEAQRPPVILPPRVARSRPFISVSVVFLALLSDCRDQGTQVDIRPPRPSPEVRIPESRLAEIQADVEGSFLMAETRRLQDGQDVGLFAQWLASCHHGLQFFCQRQSNRHLDFLQFLRCTFNFAKLSTDCLQWNSQGVSPKTPACKLLSDLWKRSVARISSHFIVLLFFSLPARFPDPDELVQELP